MASLGDQEQIAYLDFIDENSVACRVEIVRLAFSLGRGNDNDLRIEDSRISRQHAEIIRTSQGQYLFRDKGSKGGSFINGIRVQEHTLQVGDRIVLGGLDTPRLTFGFAPRRQTSSETLEIHDHSRPGLDTTEMAVNASSGSSSARPFRAATVITDRETRFLNTALMRQPEYVTDSTLPRLTSLYEITHKLLPVQNVNELAQIWLDELFQALPVERGAILLYNSATNSLDLAISRTGDIDNTDDVHISNSIVEHTFQNNVAILTNDATSDERFSARASVIFENIHSVICAPISSKLRVWGVCYLDSRTRSALFSSEDLEFLMATAREAGLVIENLRLIEELRATQEQLVKSERLATIGKLTSSISHELRNRLALLNGIEFIEMKYGHDPEVREFANMVLTGQRRALALVEEIRDFARNRPEYYEKTRRPIVPAIEQTLSILKLDVALSRRKLQFTYTATPELCFNEDKIEQVIINLVRNAVEATVDYEGEIDIMLGVEDDAAVLTISDNGVGIAPEMLSRIWEPFFTTKGEDGTGLGLEICRRIIEAHGGSIFCQSEVGKGTCFMICLPLG
ncbi:MAG: ATP-binding protein [Acidobacteriota bacterium]